MAADDVPKWVWDLVIAVQRHEAVHGKQDPCLKGVLAAVPQGIRTQAEGIAAYVQQAHGSEMAEKAMATWNSILGSLFGPPHEEATP